MEHITVVIPAYNEEALIAGTLESLFANTEAPLRVVVVANGCTDKTSSLARGSRVEVVELEQAGVSRARNVGAGLADSTYILFLDADTRVEPGFVDDLLRKATTTGAAVVLGDNRPDVQHWKARLFLWAHNLGHRVYRAPMGFIFTRRDVFARVGGFDESLAKGEDIKFVHRAIRLGTLEHVAGSRAIMSMRRFEKWGYFYTTIYWMIGALFPDNDYPAVR